jgi:hypothetical protein
MKPLLSRIALVGVVPIAILVAWIAWLNLEPRPTPAGQQPLGRLNEESFHQLRDAFNASADRTRIVALLSPT